VNLTVEPMDLDDISQVLEVDRESYTVPWPASAYRREILHNRTARYLVLREAAQRDPDGEGGDGGAESDQRGRHHFSFLRWPLRSGDGQQSRRGRILGYAGMWLMVDEAHITTIAVRTEWRRRGYGELLLVSLVDAARDIGISRMTLEVRVSNESAQNLYRKYGFEQRGVRPRYYSDNNEDAYIMSTGDIHNMSYGRRFEGKVESLRRRLAANGDATVTATLFDSLPQHETAQGAE
jgi:[ribosomal protein S18]-alanine N-acetyltransferase